MNTPTIRRIITVAAVLFVVCVSAHAQEPSPQPRIIQPQFPTEDMVVADTIVTEKPYEADNSGEKDVTTILQQALNDCATNGGGTVWMPAGTYKFVESTTLTYWLRPETESARRAGIELYFAEGGNLRDSQALDLQGKRMHPTEAKGEVNKWTKIECPLGRWFAGKTVRAIGVAHDDGESTGMFKADFDDLFIGVPPEGKP